MVAPWENESRASTNTSTARGEIYVVTTAARDVSGRDPLTFEKAARTGLALDHRLS